MRSERFSKDSKSLILMEKKEKWLQCQGLLTYSPSTTKFPKVLILIENLSKEVLWEPPRLAQMRTNNLCSMLQPLVLESAQPTTLTTFSNSKQSMIRVAARARCRSLPIRDHPSLNLACSNLLSVQRRS
jgi:hypothetical protein